MDLDRLLLDLVVEEGHFEKIIESGLASDDFEGEFAELITFLFDYYSNPRHGGNLPTVNILRRQKGFNNYRPQKHKEKLEWVISEIRRRSAYNAMQNSMAKIATAMKQNNVDEAQQIFTDTSIRLAARMTDIKTTSVTENTHLRKKRYLARKSGEDDWGIPTGFEWLDTHTMKWQPSDLVMCIAKRGTGKTWWLLLTSYSANTAGNPVMFVSREMATKALETRYDAIYTGLPYSKIRRGELESQEEKFYFKKLAEMKGGVPFFIPEFEGRCTPLAIQAKARELGCKFIAIDGVYMLQDDQGTMRGWERHYNIAEGLKSICKTDGVTIIITNQINREESAKDADLDNSAYSDAYGHFADVALKLVQGRDERAKGIMLMQLLKVREDDCPDTPERIQWDFDNMVFGSDPTYDDITAFRY